MNIVIDFNILFSSLLKSPNKFSEFIFLSENKFFAPLYLRSEFFKHQDKLVKLTKVESHHLNEMFSLLLENIHLIDENLISQASRQHAYDFCKGIDEYDMPYLALALEMNAQLWTGDKKLISGLTKRGFSNFFQL